MCDEFVGVGLTGSIGRPAPLTSSETDACQCWVTAPQLALSVPAPHTHINTHTHTLSASLPDVTVLDIGGQ